MLNVKVDRGDLTDLYEQIAGEIRRAIAEGEAKAGRAPTPCEGSRRRPHRQHEHGVACAAAAPRRGAARVPAGARHLCRRTPEHGAVVQRAKELVVFARQQGYRLEKLVAIIEDVG